MDIERQWQNEDIYDHIQDLSDFVNNMDLVVEFGVRYGVGSTLAFINGKPKKLISCDIANCENIDKLIEAAKENGVDFEFKIESSLVADIPKCDFLFIDTDHKYETTKSEITRHKSKCRYIGFHDTVTCEAGVLKPIKELLPDWTVILDKKNNNGLMILENPCFQS